MKKEILENMKQIRQLKAENKKLNEQIKDDGIQLANKLLNSLYARLKIYTAFLKELSTGMNIKTSKEKTFVDNNLMITLNKLFKLKNDFKDTGELDLIEPIIEAIDSIEDYISEDLD